MSNFKRLRILEFLQWNDRHGCYTDENCDLDYIANTGRAKEVRYA